MPFPVLEQGLVISTSELGCIAQAHGAGYSMQAGHQLTCPRPGAQGSGEIRSGEALPSDSASSSCMDFYPMLYSRDHGAPVNCGACDYRSGPSHPQLKAVITPLKLSLIIKHNRTATDD
jgi:hypothetical protein